jgi:hypothetical protein
LTDWTAEVLQSVDSAPHHLHPAQWNMIPGAAMPSIPQPIKVIADEAMQQMKSRFLSAGTLNSRVHNPHHIADVGRSPPQQQQQQSSGPRADNQDRIKSHRPKDFML